MSRLSRFVLLAFVIGCAFLLPAGPAAAIDFCGDGTCNTNTTPSEATYCWADCGAGTDPCPGDTCEKGSCSRPEAGVDLDYDGVPDRLEHDLAHKFFPAALLQRHDEDRSESYLYQYRPTPFTLTPYLGNGTLCDAPFECLEIRWGITFFMDYGDTALDIGMHQGDSEMYAALLRRSPFWSGAPDDPDGWEMFRDFTSAHWGGLGDSSVVGAYGYCPEPCATHDDDSRSCNARPTCKASGTCSGWSGCTSFQTESECLSRSCTWSPVCVKRFAWVCYDDWVKDTHATLFCAESKHALYHSDDECDGGGWLYTDDCPNNEYDMREWKEGLLQNVGNATSHSEFDTTILSPGYCGQYDVWGGHEFGDATSYLQHFTATLNWALW